MNTILKAELFQKDIPKKERVFYYESETDDPIQTDEQEKGQEVKEPVRCCKEDLV